MTTIKQVKPKLLNTLDGLVAHLQADLENTPATEWQSVMVARECLAMVSAVTLAKAISKVAEKLKVTSTTLPS